jgi:Ca2+-binding RTX toxin-like protein
MGVRRLWARIFTRPPFPHASWGVTAATLAPLVLTAGLLSACAPAHGTVRVDASGILLFGAAADKANDVTVTVSGADVLVSDSGDTITPGSGCTAEDADTARCTSVTLVFLNLGNGDDSASNTTNVTSSLVGGPGNDVLDGGPATDELSGDEGADTLNGNGGDDALKEGRSSASTDVLDADTFNGGLGRDFARYDFSTQSIGVDLDGVADDGRPNEGDNVKADVQGVTGGAAADRLVGNSGDNALIGSGGADELIGGLGIDTLRGQVGDDRLVEATGAANTDALDADTFVGDTGVDTVSYQDATVQVQVDLDGVHGGVGDDGRFGEGDNVFVDVENITGGGGDDVLTGNTVANRLEGRAGPDTISGAAGPDVLRGDAGFDLLNGGTETDDCDVGGVGADGGSEFNCED